MASLNDSVAAITAAKKKWAEAQAAGDRARMDAAHAEAEAVRAGLGYSGGDDGSKEIAIAQEKPATTGAGMSDTASAGPSGIVPVADQGAPSIQSYVEDIKALYAAQKQAQLAGLAKARDNALSTLGAEAATIAPQYYEKRNAAGSQSEINRMNFAEYMANRGMSGSGAAAQAEISRQGSLQGTIGGLNQQEQAANDEIARRRTQAMSDYESNVLAAGSQIDAQEAAARIAELQRVSAANIAQYNTDRNYNLTKTDSDRTYDMNRTNSDRTYELNKATTEASLAASALDQEIKSLTLQAMKDPNSPENQTKLIALESAKAELAQAQALAAVAPEQAKLQLEAIRANIRQSNASTSASYASIANAEADNARQETAAGTARDAAEQTRLMSIWEAQGTAPAGILGVAPGTPWASKVSSPSPQKPADVVSIRNNLLQAASGTGTKFMQDDGTEKTVYTNQLGGEAIVAEIERLEATGQISAAEADWLAENVPSAKAFLTAQTARGMLQARGG